MVKKLSQLKQEINSHKCDCISLCFQIFGKEVVQCICANLKDRFITLVDKFYKDNPEFASKKIGFVINGTLIKDMSKTLSELNLSLNNDGEKIYVHLEEEEVETVGTTLSDTAFNIDVDA